MWSCISNRFGKKKFLTKTLPLIYIGDFRQALSRDGLRIIGKCTFISWYGDFGLLGRRLQEGEWSSFEGLAGKVWDSCADCFLSKLKRKQARGPGLLDSLQGFCWKIDLKCKIFWHGFYRSPCERLEGGHPSRRTFFSRFFPNFTQRWHDFFFLASHKAC